MNWYGIWALKTLGLAKQIKLVDVTGRLRGDYDVTKEKLVTADVVPEGVAGD